MGIYFDKENNIFMTNLAFHLKMIFFLDILIQSFSSQNASSF